MATAEDSKIQNLVIPEIDWDFMSGYPLPHLNFLLDRLMPEWNISTNSASQQAVQNHVQEIFKCQKNQLCPLLIGSFMENLHLPPSFKVNGGRLSELWQETPQVDIMVVPEGCYAGIQDQKHNIQCQYWIDIFKDDPNFELTTTTESTSSNKYLVEINGKVCMTATKFVEEFLSELPKDDHGLNLQIPNQENDVPDRTLKFSDPILAIPCPDWPTPLRVWHTRTRASGWPSENLLDEILQDGCHVVPSCSGQSHQWAFSFARAEQKLALSMTLEQRQCYLLLKLLMQEILTPPQILNSYIIKNLLFWSMERIPAEQWQDSDSGLAAPFLCLLDELMYALIEGRLQQYFNPEYNLLSGVPDDFLQDLMGKVSNIRKNPIQYLLKIEGYRKFRHSTVQTSFRDIQQPIEDNIQTYHDSSADCHEKHLGILHHLGTTYLHDGRYEGAYDCCVKKCDLIQLCGKKQTLLPLLEMESMIATLEVQQAVFAYEYIIKRFSGDDLEILWLTNLASMYTCLYSGEPDGSKAEEYKLKADKGFQKALESKESYGAVVVDYTIFLRKCGRTTDAIPLLQESIKKYHNVDMLNAYGDKEKSSLDDNLTELLNDMEEIQVNSVIFCHYHLVQCYLASNQKSRAEQMMQSFNDKCQTDCTAISLSLLGYCYKDLAQYQEARDTFTKVLSMEPSYESAQKNKNVSEAMLNVSEA